MKIGIVGLGLIGGSLGLALQEKGHTVVGIDPDGRTRDEALRRRAASEVSSGYAELATLELVILAVPLGSTLRVAEELVPALAAGTILTDTASVKGPIVGGISQLVPQGVSFVGGHPMFGVERRGIDAAEAKLVRGAPFILTPRPDTNTAAVALLSNLVRELGMRPVEMTPEEHDARLATLSHLPQLLAAALSLEADDTSCAGPSFLGATRTAMSPPYMLTHIVRMNRPAILAALATLTETLSSMTRGSDDALLALLEEARRRRLELDKERLP